jgi:Domain of unknown function (DUF6458)
VAALGIILLVAGAIVAFAVHAAVDNVNLVILGWILMGAGALSLIVALVRNASMATRHSVSERHVSPDGRDVVEESKTGF